MGVRGKAAGHGTARAGQRGGRGDSWIGLEKNGHPFQGICFR